MPPMTIDNTFIDFVNSEVPKRISTNADPLHVGKGLIPVTTGLGLETVFERMPDIYELGLVTDDNLILDSSGKARLTKIPHGGILLNMALVKLNDDSYVEVTEVYVVDEQYVQIATEDYNILKDTIASITVSYLGDLEEVLV